MFGIFLTKIIKRPICCLKESPEVAISLMSIGSKPLEVRSSGGSVGRHRVNPRPCLLPPRVADLLPHFVEGHQVSTFKLVHKLNLFFPLEKRSELRWFYAHTSSFFLTTKFKV